MFDDIGSKIKTLAKVECWLGIIASIIIGLVMLSSEEDSATATGLLVIVFGSLISWIASFTLYGFGELIESNTSINSNLEIQNRLLQDIVSKKTPGNEIHKDNRIKFRAQFRCDVCGNMITSKPCPYCEEKRARETPKQEYQKVPIKIFKTSNDMIICPICKTEQNGNRYKCFKCEQIFINGQPDIPYWCGTCGHPGPYEGKCPECESSMKVMNN